MSHRDPEDRVVDVAKQALSTAFELATKTAKMLHELYQQYKKKPGLTDEERIAKVVAEVFKQQQSNSVDQLSSDQLKTLLETRIQQEQLLKEREQIVAAREEVLGQEADLDPVKQQAQKDLVKELDQQLEDVDQKLAELDGKQANTVAQKKGLDAPGRIMKPGSIGESLEKEGYFKKQAGPALKVGLKHQ